METPDILPAELKDIARFDTDWDLYNHLLKTTERLVTFFSYAADDETWSTRHQPFMQLSLNWLTGRYLEDRLEEGFAEEIVRSIQNHYEILNPILPRPISLSYKEELFPINPLIAGIGSPYLHHLMRRDYQPMQENVLKLAEGDLEMIPYVLRYLEKGDIGDLWKWEEKRIETLLKICEKWRISKLADEAQHVLCRYVNHKNAVEKLISAQKLGRTIIRAKCIEIINENEIGIKLYSPAEDALGFEFGNFLDKALALFNQVKGVITHLSISGRLTLDETFEKVIHACPKLFGLDISGSDAVTPYLSSIPKQLQEINLSHCPWLNDFTLRMIAAIIPQVKTLNLAQDTQISYLGFGELKQFGELKSLDLSRCNQLSNSELAIVIQATRELIELKLISCKRLSDQAFYDLARKAPRLQSIDLSRTALTDGALIEIGTRLKELQSLHINHCVSLSDLGLFEFLKIARELRFLSAKESLIEDAVFRKLQKQFPRVEILF